MSCQWQSLLCQVEAGQLKMYCEEGCEESPQYTVQLRGCEVRPGPDTPSSYRITLLQHGDQVAVLEVLGSGGGVALVVVVAAIVVVAANVYCLLLKGSPLAGTKVELADLPGIQQIEKKI